MEVSLTLLDKIFTSLSDTIMMINKKGTILKANEAAPFFRSFNWIKYYF